VEHLLGCFAHARLQLRQSGAFGFRAGLPGLRLECGFGIAHGVLGGGEVMGRLAGHLSHALRQFAQSLAQFFLALGRALRWSDSDFAEFARDFDLYHAIAERESRAPQQRGSKSAVSGAFVDRCGLLLDPSMLEQARRAAAQFQSRLNGATDQVLKRVFAAHREN
jgi:hypothetical protein